MFTPIPKRFEDMSYSEIIEHKRNKARSEKGMERVMKGFPRNPILDTRSRPNAARGARPDTFYKQQRNNLNNGKVKIENTFDSEGTY